MRGDELLDYWLAAQTYDMLLDARKAFGGKTLEQRLANYHASFKRVYPEWRRNEFNDDLLWWVISLTRAAKELKSSAQLREAREIYDHLMSHEIDSQLGGGVWWRNNEHKGKHACSTFPAVIAAAELYELTKNRKYRDSAIAVYEWGRTHLLDPQSGRVYDNMSVSGHVDKANYTYNNGTCIGAALRVYKLTHQAKYRDDARKAVEYLMRERSPNGILCGSGQGDGGAFNGIAMRYLAEYAEATDAADVRMYLVRNAESAWRHRRKSDGLCGPDWAKTPADDFDLEGQTAGSGVTLFLQLALQGCAK